MTVYFLRLILVAAIGAASLVLMTMVFTEVFLYWILPAIIVAGTLYGFTLMWNLPYYLYRAIRGGASQP